MKKILLFGFFLFALSICAQPNTEVFLFDITDNNGKLELTNLKNISNNEGYDNQPSFYDDNTVIFASTRNSQTDIAKYNVTTGETTWITNTPGGSEYSPLKIPESNNISAVRLDTTGFQRLHKYNITDGTSTFVLDKAKVGYHSWFSSEMLVATVLVENRMDLITSHLADSGQFKTAQENVGRSLQKIPNSELVSFISKIDGGNSLNSINPKTLEVKVITPLSKEVEDICWLSNGYFLVPERNMIYVLEKKKKSKPSIINLSNYEELNTITRMALSPDGKHLALVSNESPSKIVQKQVDSYNAGDLDAFVNCYAKDVVVRNFPIDTLYVGHESMRKNYQGLSPENRTYDVEVVKRIIIGNKVIDHEKVMQNGKFQQMQVALYEVNNGKISSMSFIFDDTKASNPETIVQKQMVAYNSRDIDAFLETYTDGIKVFNFPNEARYTGKEKMRESYTGFFDSTPDLNYIIKNRMVIANYVIDEEYITANGNNFSAVAIYEVENGKIAKVTFLR